MSQLKSFFRTILMWDNPTKGLMCGFTFGFLTIMLSAVILLTDFSITNTASEFRIYTLFFVTLLLLLYSYTLYAIGVFGYLKEDYKKPLSLWLTAIGFIILPYAFLTVLFLLNIKDRKPYFIPFSLGSLLLMRLVTKSYNELLFIAFILITTIALAGTKRQTKLNWLFIYSLTAIILIESGAGLYLNHLNQDIAIERANLSKIIGRSIEIEDFIQRRESSINLETLQKSAQNLMNQVIQEPSNKPMIKEYNSDLIEIRELILNSSLELDHTYLASSIEQERLLSLSHPIATGEYTKEELLELIGDTPNWGKIVALSLGDEMTKKELENQNQNLPLLLKVYEQMDFYNLLKYNQELATALITKTERLTYYYRTNATDSPYLSIVIQSLSDIYTINSAYETRHLPELAVTAVEIMEQYKKNNKLPTAEEFQTNHEITYNYGDLVDRSGKKFSGFKLQNPNLPEYEFNVIITP